MQRRYSPVDLTATDNCSGDITVSPTEVNTPGACPNQFTIVRTWTFSDECGNESSVMQNISVNDDTPPVAPNPPADITEQCSADIPPPIDLTATDNCSGDITVSPTEVNTPGTCPNQFTIIRTWTFTDECGNESSVTQNISVNDDTPPVAPNPPADITEQCSADIPPPVDLTATDNCSGDITVSPTEVNTPGACPNQFTIVRTWTFSDECGNESSVTQNISVNDDTPPVAPNPPADITEQCSADIPPPVDLTATDNCSGDITVSPTEVNTPGACPNQFTIVRTWTFSDECGNESSVMQNISVNDDTPPTADNLPTVNVTCLADFPPFDIEDVTGEADNCTATPIVSFVSDVSDNASCPETITRTYSVTDECNNSIDVVQTIIIGPDTELPTIVCPNDITGLESLADLPAPDISLVTASDNCAFTVEFVSDMPDPATFDFCNGNNIIVRTYRVIDECGNISTCTQNISFDVLNCFEFSSSDPCECNNDQSANGAGDGTFSESVVVIGAPGVNVCAGPLSTGILNPLDNSDISNSSFAFVESLNADGTSTYTLDFNHLDAVGYTLEFYDCDTNTPIEMIINGANVSTITNNCYYPIISFMDIEDLCENDAPVDLVASLINDMPNGLNSFGGGFTFTGNGIVNGNQFDPSIGNGIYTLTANYQPSNAVGTSIENNDAVCETSLEISVTVFDLPEPQFDCPVTPIDFCGGEIDLNAIDVNPTTANNSTGVWSGLGATLINTMGTSSITDDVLDPSTAVFNVQYDLILTLESADGCIVESAVCNFTVVSNCAANGGRF